MIALPALAGRYGEIAFCQLVGRAFTSGVMTKNKATNAEIPPAVLRRIAPQLECEQPDKRHVEGASDDGARARERTQLVKRRDPPPRPARRPDSRVLPSCRVKRDTHILPPFTRALVLVGDNNFAASRFTPFLLFAVG